MSCGDPRGMVRYQDSLPNNDVMAIEWYDPFNQIISYKYNIWVRSRNCGCLVTWFCYQLIAKPGYKTAAVPWPDPYIISSRIPQYVPLIPSPPGLATNHLRCVMCQLVVESWQVSVDMWIQKHLEQLSFLRIHIVSAQQAGWYAMCAIF